MSEPVTIGDATIINADVIEGLQALIPESVQCVVTSPPYWGLRDYGVDGMIGLEDTLDEYLARMVEVFREVRRVLRQDGTLWLNMGDAYANPSQPGGGDPTIGQRNLGGNGYKKSHCPASNQKT